MRAGEAAGGFHELSTVNSCCHLATRIVLSDEKFAAFSYFLLDYREILLELADFASYEVKRAQLEQDNDTLKYTTWGHDARQTRPLSSK